MTATPTLFGLKNCDGCRRALRWFEGRGIDLRFVDIRDPQNTPTALKHVRASGKWEAFVNKRSTTWRQLSDKQKTDLDEAATLALLAEHPTLIKRPLLVIGKAVLAGFDENAVVQALG